MMYNCAESNITAPIYLQEPFGVTIFTLGLQIAVGIFGVIGNAVVCITIIRKPHVLGPSSQYLFSLAVADLGILTVNFPIAILKQQDPFKWYFGEVACLYVAPATETFFGAAIFSITLISFQRYDNIARKAIRPRRMRSRNRRRLVLAVVWAASFALTSVPLYIFHDYDPCHNACYPTWSPMIFLIYIIAITLLLYVLPLATIAFSYMTIARLVSKRTRIILQDESRRCIKDADRETHPQSSSLKTMLRQKRKTYRILKPLVILFAITMLPLTVFRLVIAFWSDLPLKNYYTIVFTLVAISTVVNSAADPLVYCVVNKEFRQEVKCILPGNFLQKVNTVLRRSQASDALTETSRASASLRTALVQDTSV